MGNIALFEHGLIAMNYESYQTPLRATGKSRVAALRRCISTHSKSSRSLCEQSDHSHLELLRAIDVLSDGHNAPYYNIKDECPLEEAHMPMFTHSFFRLVAAAFHLAEGLNNTPVRWPDVLATHSILNLHSTHAASHNTNPSRNRRQRQKRKRDEKQSKPPF